jgi:hypothetical protein
MKLAVETGTGSMHDIHAKFRTDWSSHSKVDKRGRGNNSLTYRQHGDLISVVSSKQRTSAKNNYKNNVWI